MHQCHFNSLEIRMCVYFMIKHLKDFISVGPLGIKVLLFLLPSHLSAYQHPMVSSSSHRLTLESQKLSKAT